MKTATQKQCCFLSNRIRVVVFVSWWWACIYSNSKKWQWFIAESRLDKSDCGWRNRNGKKSNDIFLLEFD